MEFDIGVIANANAYVSGAFSICLNTYLLIAISRSRARVAIGLYRWMMLISSTFDIVFSFLTAIACPTIAAIRNMSSVLFVKGGFPMPHEIGRALLNAWILLLCLSIIVSPCLFVFRYFQVCRKNWMTLHGRRIFYLFIIPIFFSLSAAAMLNYAAYPSANDIEHFRDIAYGININGYRAFLVASLRASVESDDVIKANVLVAACVNLLFILICSLLAMIACSRSMIHAVKDAKSATAVRLQAQLQKSLVIQFIIPFLFIQIPFCACCLAPLFNVETGPLADILPFLFAWSPALNPFVVLYLVRDLCIPLKDLLCKKKSAALGSSGQAEDKKSNVFRLRARPTVDVA